jgi:hypothetical protein
MTETAYTKKGKVTRWLGVAQNPAGLRALEARLIAVGNHKVRIPADTTEAQNLKRRRAGDENLSKGGVIDSGQPIWAITRQASVYRTPNGARHVLFFLNAVRTKVLTKLI